MADIAGGTVAVVGQSLNDNGNTARTVALIYDILIIITVSTSGSLFDDTLNVFIGHIISLSLGDTFTKLRV